jgi:hypothetical protein
MTSQEETPVTLDANKALIRHVFEKVIPANDPAALRDLVAPDCPRPLRLIPRNRRPDGDW